MAGLKSDRREAGRSLSPEEWPDWVLVPQVSGAGFTEQYRSFHEWRARRNAWAAEHTTLPYEFRGRLVFGRFLDAANLEHRRRAEQHRSTPT